MQIKFKPWTPPAVTLDKMPSYLPYRIKWPSHPFQHVAMKVGCGAYTVTADGKMGEYLAEAEKCTVLDATPTPTHSGDLPPGVWFETCCQPHPLTKTVEDGKYVSTQGRLFRPAQNEYFPVTRILGTMEVEDAG